MSKLAVKDELFSMTQAWDKEKFSLSHASLQQESNPWCPKHIVGGRSIHMNSVIINNLALHEFS